MAKEALKATRTAFDISIQNGTTSAQVQFAPPTTASETPAGMVPVAPAHMPGMPGYRGGHLQISLSGVDEGADYRAEIKAALLAAADLF